MPLSFPLPLSQFWGDRNHVGGLTFHLTGNTVAEISSGGEVFTSTRGTRLWTGQVSFARRSAREIRRTDAILSELREAGTSFLIFPLDAEYPQNDPTGGLLGAATPTVSFVFANGAELSVAGLPAGYVLRQGDFLSFPYGANPVRQALHQVVRDRTADAGGTIQFLQLTPRIRPGLATGTVLTLVRPVCKAIVRPRSHQPATFARVHGEGLGFEFIQTLR
jgi:hypothetical protein